MKKKLPARRQVLQLIMDALTTIETAIGSERERRRACALAARLDAPLAERAKVISKAMCALSAAVKKAASKRLPAARKDLHLEP